VLKNRIFGLKREEVTGGWGNVRRAARCFTAYYGDPKRRMRGAWHVARMI
jgi:hypothetical protein